MTDTTPGMGSGNDTDMTMRDMVIEMRNDLKWIKNRLSEVCTEVYGEHPKDHRAMDKRLRRLEDWDAKLEGLMKQKKEGGAGLLTIISVIISAIAVSVSIIVAIAAFKGG